MLRLAPTFNGRRSLPPLSFFFHRAFGKTQSVCLAVLSGASEEVIDLRCSVEESSGATCRPPLPEALTVLTEPYGTLGELVSC
jgi:hypothetical protein